MGKQQTAEGWGVADVAITICDALYSMEQAGELPEDLTRFTTRCPGTGTARLYLETGACYVVTVRRLADVRPEVANPTGTAYDAMRDPVAEDDDDGGY